MKKILPLDGLRGVAVLMVIWQHLPDLSGWNTFNLIPRFFNFGYFGVDIFFVLSGFLITRILIKEKSENDFSFKRFYLKRALRIFPIYYLTIILVALLITKEALAPIAFYYSNYYFALDQDPHPLRHTWSLAVEEHFYLVWPVLIQLLPLHKAKKVILVAFPVLALTTAIITAILLPEPVADELLYRGTSYRILTLAAGSYFAFIERHLYNLQPRKILLLIVTAGILYAANIALANDFEHVPGHLTSLLLLTPISCIIFRIAIGLKNSNPILTNSPLRFIGRISYGLYLYHFPIFYLFGILVGEASAGDVIAPVIVTFTTAVLSYFLIEKRFLHLKEKLTVPQVQPLKATG